MGTKRFTDSRKWNEWFRSLPLKAKVVWSYLWDECELDGIWKADFGLMTFHVGFPVGAADLTEWFGNKIFLFGEEVLIVPFFYEQYSETKDTWSAKIKARQTLEAKGFKVEKNQVLDPHSYHSGTTVVVECTHSTSISKSRSKGIKGGVGEKELRTKIEFIYRQFYPRKKGKSKGVDHLVTDMTLDDVPNLEKAAIAYRDETVRDKIEPKFIKHFSNFAKEWRDHIPEAQPPPKINFLKVAENFHRQVLESKDPDVLRRTLGDQYDWLEKIGIDRVLELNDGVDNGDVILSKEIQAIATQNHEATQ